MILAAGLGTRLKELTHDRPKALVEIAGKPLLQRAIENLSKSGFDTVIVNVHHYGDQVIRFLETHDFGLKVYVSDERGALMDTGGGIVQALPFFHHTPAVLVHNVDILSDVDLKGYYDRFVSSDDDAWLLVQARNTSRKLLFGDDGMLVGWRNLNDGSFKWVSDEVNHYHELAFNGMHLFKPSLFEGIEYGHYSIIDVYLQLARCHAIRAQVIQPSYWFDVGKAEDFNRIHEFLIRNKA